MQIEVDFEVFKALTLLRECESDSYSNVISRLLKSTSHESLESAPNALANALKPGVENALAGLGRPITPSQNALAGYAGGAWFDNMHFPEGTRFRATYKGESFSAEIMDGSWIGEDGIRRTSPSAAASAISDTNVNGWRFWFVKRPTDDDWVRMDELRS